MKAILFAIAATFAATAASGQESAPYKARDCGQLTVQQELNACAGDNLRIADASLNTLYARLMAEQDNAAAKAQLREVERAWIAYRDKECAFEVGPQADGGSIWPMEMSNCLEEKTAARIRELIKVRGCPAEVAVCNPR